MISPAIPGWFRSAMATPLLVRLGSAPLAFAGAQDASREDADAPSARSASFEDAGVGLPRRVGVAPSTVRLPLKRLASERTAQLAIAGRDDRQRNQGVDTRSLQHYLGHNNIQHTTRYTELAVYRFKNFWRD